MIYLFSIAVVLFIFAGWAIEYHDQTTGWRIDNGTILATVGLKSISVISIYLAAFSITYALITKNNLA